MGPKKSAMAPGAQAASASTRDESERKLDIIGKEGRYEGAMVGEGRRRSELLATATQPFILGHYALHAYSACGETSKR